MYINVSVRVLFILCKNPVSCCNLLIKITNQLRRVVCHNGCWELHYQSFLFKDFSKYFSDCGNKLKAFSRYNQNVAFQCYIWGGELLQEDWGAAGKQKRKGGASLPYCNTYLSINSLCRTYMPHYSTLGYVLAAEEKSCPLSGKSCNLATTQGVLLLKEMWSKTLAYVWSKGTGTLRAFKQLSLES